MFLQWIVEQPAFRRGQIVTDFLDREWQPRVDEVPDDVVAAVAVAEAVLQREKAPSGRDREGEHFNPWLVENGWRVARMPREFTFEVGGHPCDVVVEQEEGDHWKVSMDGQIRELQLIGAHDGELVLRQGHVVQRMSVLRSGREVSVAYQGASYRLRRWGGPQSSGGRATGRNETGLTAPMPGTVIKVAVQQGQRVEAREPLVVLEAMKMEHVIAAPVGGVVTEILYREGDLVPAGAPVVRLESV
jgi:3-methylcrotonyl-CoA carboxylase alpha subunit